MKTTYLPKTSERGPPLEAVSRDPRLIFFWGCSLGIVLSICENPVSNGLVPWEKIDLQKPAFLKNRVFERVF